MQKSPPAQRPRVIPFIAYEDADAAIEWLTRAFGFRERLRYRGPDGRITHAELELDHGVIMLAEPTPDYESPRRHREHCEKARRWLALPWVIDGLLVYVDDVDGHFTRARAEGAGILSEPQDTPYGDRHYRVEDLEGHRWMFAQHVRDVAPQEWGATVAATKPA